MVRSEHDQLILADLNRQLDRMELADQNEVEDARENIIAIVEILLLRLAQAEPAYPLKLDPVWADKILGQGRKPE